MDAFVNVVVAFVSIVGAWAPSMFSSKTTVNVTVAPTSVSDKDATSREAETTDGFAESIANAPVTSFGSCRLPAMSFAPEMVTSTALTVTLASTTSKKAVYTRPSSSQSPDAKLSVVAADEEKSIEGSTDLSMASSYDTAKVSAPLPASSPLISASADSDDVSSAPDATTSSTDAELLSRIRFFDASTASLPAPLDTFALTVIEPLVSSLISAIWSPVRAQAFPVTVAVFVTVVVPSDNLTVTV